MSSSSRRCLICNIEKYEAFCLQLLGELQQRQPRAAQENLSVWFQASMRQTATQEMCWQLPQAFRRIDIKLSAALIEALRSDPLLFAPLTRLAKACLLAGTHVPARLVMTIVSQASSKPERLLQDALESRIDSITMREPPSVPHLPRFLNDLLTFAAECPANTIQCHKLEDKVMLQVSRVEIMADDVTMYNRQPWARRSWTTLIEIVRHFGAPEEQKKTLERGARQFERNEAKR